MVPQSRTHAAEPRVLVIEDEVLIRIAVAEELRAAGLHVIETVNADEAWDYFKAGGQVDLIFSDVAMPGSMNGLEFAKRIRDKFPAIPIVLTSGNAHYATEKFGRFLPKPYVFEDAVKVIREALNLDQFNNIP
ncbi:MAG TPA: response regulator [Methylovirgula sp.]|jgi:CheY-like chemotaxis protein